MESKSVKSIGFDLGHGETALARIKVLDMAEPVKAEPEMLDICGKKSQITAIAHTIDGRTLIGEDALEESDAITFEVAFKGRPTGNPTQSHALQDFAEAVYQHLSDFGQIDKEDDNRFFIGSPSGWESEFMEKYQRILASSGIPKLTVVHESRAALLHAKETKGLTRSNLEKSVLVIDIGSSTTDCTVVKGFDYTLSTAKSMLLEPNSAQELLEKAIDDFGDDLGGSLIDEAIFQWTLAQHPQRAELEAVFMDKRFSFHKRRCLIACRKAKERYFSQETAFENHWAKAHEFIEFKYAFEVKINGSVMRQILEQPIATEIDNRRLSAEVAGKSWPAAFRSLLNRAKKRMDSTPSVVLLTGGASRMPFVLQTCKEVFDKSRVERDAEPEYSIARGLARWGRVSLLAAAFLEEVERFSHEEMPQFIRDKVPDLIKTFEDQLDSEFVERVEKPGLLAWITAELRTAKQLDERMLSLTQELLNSDDIKRLIAGGVDKWCHEVQESLYEHTLNICQRYDIPAGSVTVPVKPVVESVTKLLEERLYIPLADQLSKIEEFFLSIPSHYPEAMRKIMRDSKIIRGMARLELEGTYKLMELIGDERAKQTSGLFKKMEKAGTIKELNDFIGKRFQEELAKRSSEATFLIR